MSDQSFNSSNGQTSSNFARVDVGSIDLRGLGVGNTLVLLNGRRLVQHTSSQASTSLAPVITYNSNSIPVFGIQRLEVRSEEKTSELQSLMRISYAVFCLKTNKTKKKHIM